MENYTDMQCSQEDLEKYLDGIPYYTYIKDEDDRLVYVNKQLKVRLNKTEDHIIGHKLDELLGFKFNHADVHSYNNDDSIIIQESVYSLDNKEYCYENGIIKIDREEKSPLYGVIFKNITMDKKIYEILKNHIDELIRLKPSIENSDNLECDFSYEIMDNLKEQLKSEEVFFIVYGLNNKSFKYFDKDSEDELIKVLNSNIKKITEITSNKIKILCEEKCFSKEYEAIVNVFEIVPGITGIIIYKDKIEKEYNVYNKNRNERFISISANVMKLIIRINSLYGILRDELKKRKSSEKQLQQFLETATDLCCLVKRQDNEIKVIEITDSWQRLFGRKVKDYEDIKYIDYIHKDDRKKYMDEFCLKLKNKSELGKTKNLDLRLLDRDGEYRYIKWRWKQIEGSVTAICANDKTIEMSYEKEKIRLENNVSREKMNEKFFTNLSLQFKNPLTTIIAAIQLLELYIKKKDDESTQKKLIYYINLIEKNSYKILKWANDLIDISKIESMYNEFEIDKVNIVELIENIVEHTNDYFEEVINNIIFDTDCEEIYTGCDLKKTEKTIFMIIYEFIIGSDKNANIQVQVTHCSSEYIDIYFKSDRYILDEKRINEVMEFFYNEDEKYIRENGYDSSVRLRFSLLKDYIRLFNGKITFEKQTDKFGLILRIPIINLDDTQRILYSNKSMNSLKEKCNIEFSDIG